MYKCVQVLTSFSCFPSLLGQSLDCDPWLPLQAHLTHLCSFSKPWIHGGLLFILLCIVPSSPATDVLTPPPSLSPSTISRISGYTAHPLRVSPAHQSKALIIPPIRFYAFFLHRIYLEQSLSFVHPLLLFVVYLSLPVNFTKTMTSPCLVYNCTFKVLPSRYPVTICEEKEDWRKVEKRGGKEGNEHLWSLSPFYTIATLPETDSLRLFLHIFP